eukprot:scaffold407788_cov20-Prasinocladus_malaysianus.AAC.1
MQRIIRINWQFLGQSKVIFPNIALLHAWARFVCLIAHACQSVQFGCAHAADWFDIIACDTLLDRLLLIHKYELLCSLAMAPCMEARLVGEWQGCIRRKTARFSLRALCLPACMIPLLRKSEKEKIVTLPSPKDCQSFRYDFVLGLLCQVYHACPAMLQLRAFFYWA